MRINACNGLVASIALLMAFFLTDHAAAQTQAEQDRQAWQALEASHWIQDGSSSAARVIYTFTDPNCGYCARFRRAAAPWIEAGEVQLRHIMVGIIAESSPERAARVLAATRSMEVLHAYQGDGDVPLVSNARVNRYQSRITENNQLLRAFGGSATPTSLYRDDNGRLTGVQGMPQGDRMEEMMGGPQP